MQTATIETTPADFGVLAKQVREAGLLDRRFGYYGLMIPLTIAAFARGIRRTDPDRELLVGPRHRRRSWA